MDHIDRIGLDKVFLGIRSTLDTSRLVRAGSGRIWISAAVVIDRVSRSPKGPACADVDGVRSRVHGTENGPIRNVPPVPILRTNTKRKKG